jgi:hypothetical protein
VRVRAQSFADMRIAEVRGYPTYDNLTTTFSSSDVPESGFNRQTVVVRDKSATSTCNNPAGCPKNDVTRVTVTVANTSLSAPVARTITISAF